MFLLSSERIGAGSSVVTSAVRQLWKTSSRTVDVVPKISNQLTSRTGALDTRYCHKTNDQIEPGFSVQVSKQHAHHFLTISSRIQLWHTFFWVIENPNAFGQTTLTKI